MCQPDLELGILRAEGNGPRGVNGKQNRLAADYIRAGRGGWRVRIEYDLSRG